MPKVFQLQHLAHCHGSIRRSPRTFWMRWPLAHAHHSSVWRICDHLCDSSRYRIRHPWPYWDYRLEMHDLQ